jgi:nucleotide-binding universal stress UspA family protein
MFHHILVPLDFSPKDRAALDTAVAIARRSGSRLTLLHVVAVIEHMDAEELASFYDSLRARAEKRLGPLVGRLSEEQLTADFDISVGRPTAEILRAAREHRVDLIIMSSHKIDAARPTEGWGTVSHQVSILADCPVLLVK